jgi:hypothetical protein
MSISVFCISLFAPLFYFFWPLHCFPYFDLRLLIIVLVCSTYLGTHFNTFCCVTLVHLYIETSHGYLSSLIWKVYVWCTKRCSSQIFGDRNWFQMKGFFYLNCHIGCDFKLNACHIFIVFEIENETICKIKGLLLMIWIPRIIHVMSWKLLVISVLTTPGCSDDTMTFVSFNRRFIKYICITW